MINVTTPFWQRIQKTAYFAVSMAGLLVLFWSATAFAEPLPDELRNRALTLANEYPWPEANFTDAVDAVDAVDADGMEAKQGTEPLVTHQNHALGIQTVSIEQDVIKNSNSHQQVRVYQHSYTHYSARVVVVSLANNQVVKQALIESVHLPLTQAEHEYALTVLSANADAITLLKADQQRRGDTPFTHIKELSVKASIYKPLEKNHICAHERCALLSLFDNTNTVFAAEPVVNLQDGATMWLNP